MLVHGKTCLIPIVNDLSPKYINELVNIKIPLIISEVKRKQMFHRSTQQGMVCGRLGLKPLASGTVFRTI